MGSTSNFTPWLNKYIVIFSKRTKWWNEHQFFLYFLSSWFYTSVFERNLVAKIVHTSAAVAGFGFFSVVQARLYPFLLLAFADRKKKIPPSKANIDVRKYSGWFCNAWHLAQMKKNQKKCATSKEILYGNGSVRTHVQIRIRPKTFLFAPNRFEMRTIAREFWNQINREKKNKQLTLWMANILNICWYKATQKGSSVRNEWEKKIRHRRHQDGIECENTVKL